MIWLIEKEQQKKKRYFLSFLNQSKEWLYDYDRMDVSLVFL